MDNHFITNVEFNNFKCFKKLKINNLKRVNLISGKNNIGKTSFMEGLELFTKSKDTFTLAQNIQNMIKRRQKDIREDISILEFDIANDNENISINTDNKIIEISFIKEYYKKIDNINKRIEYKINNKFESLFDTEEDFTIKNEPAIELKIDKDIKIHPIDRLMKAVFSREYTTQNINFISSCKILEKTIAILYGNLVNLNKEDYLNDSLKLFDENIISLKIIPTQRDTILKLKMKNKEQLVLLSALGEGINRFIAILCAIWSSKDGYLYIDEIENGIHYTNYEKLWKIIFEVSKLANCQIFATTHSKECIEAFNRVNNLDDGTYLEFYKNEKTELITVKNRDYEQLNYSLSHTSKIRGE